VIVSLIRATKERGKRRKERRPDKVDKRAEVPNKREREKRF